MSNIVTALTAAEIANQRFVNINAEGKSILATTANPANGFCMVGGAIDTLVQVFMSGSVPAPLEGLPGRVVYLGADGVATMEAAAGRQQVGYLTNGGRMIISIKPKPETTGDGGGGIAIAATFFKI